MRITRGYTHLISILLPCLLEGTVHEGVMCSKYIVSFELTSTLQTHVKYLILYTDPNPESRSCLLRMTYIKINVIM